MAISNIGSGKRRTPGIVFKRFDNKSETLPSGTDIPISAVLNNVIRIACQNADTSGAGGSILCDFELKGNFGVENSIRQFRLDKIEIENSDLFKVLGIPGRETTSKKGSYIIFSTKTKTKSVSCTIERHSMENRIFSHAVCK